jgi:hypothetical protein
LLGPIALSAPYRYIRREPEQALEPRDQSMRAEIERLVEEIKQSVGLLRRHL